MLIQAFFSQAIAVESNEALYRTAKIPMPESLWTLKRKPLFSHITFDQATYLPAGLTLDSFKAKPEREHLGLCLGHIPAGYDLSQLASSHL